MAGPVRVFLNASSLPAQPAGAGVYTLQLAAALAARPGVELVVAAPRPLAGLGTVPVPGRSAATRAAWEFSRLGHAIRESRAHVYHGVHFYTPRRTAVPRVATIHDLTFFRIPRRYSAARRRYYRAIARTAREAERVIVPSEAVAADVMRYLDYPAARVRVIPEAPRSGLAPSPSEAVREFRARSGLDGRYFVCLGTAEPGKRAVDAVRALPAISRGHPGVLLALAGNPGRLSEALMREAARLGVAGQVRPLGYVPDADLAPLLTGAEALIFPSLYEGFGLPPLEAMACGTPVIASRAPAMDAVLEGGAAFVPLRDPAAIAREATLLLSDPSHRAWRAEAGRAHAARFTWDRAAALTEDVYREVAR